jgi:hypothetical protein
LTANWPGPAWLDCQGKDAEDGNVSCTVQVLGGGKRELVVPVEYFDAQHSRLKVRVIRHSQPEDYSTPDCPSQEISGFIVETF